MLKNYKGFTLLELTISLCFMMLLVIFYIPSYLRILQEHENLKQRNAANAILNEEIQKYYFDEDKNDFTVIERDGAIYEVNWEAEDEDPSLNKACVSWGESSNRSKQRCVYATKE